MSDDVERAARVICDVIGIEEYDATDDFNRDDFREMAKAALSVTRLERYRAALEKIRQRAGREPGSGRIARVALED